MVTGTGHTLITPIGTIMDIDGYHMDLTFHVEEDSEKLEDIPDTEDGFRYQTSLISKSNVCIKQSAQV
jgi:hypothetical protein